MKKRDLTLVVGLLLVSAQAYAQQRVITGKVTSDQGMALSGAQVLVKGTGVGTLTNTAGTYSIRASSGQTLSFSYIGYSTLERVVTPATTTLNVELKTSVVNLAAVEVTALGQTATRRSLGSSQQTVR